MLHGDLCAENDIGFKEQAEKLVIVVTCGFLKWYLLLAEYKGAGEYKLRRGFAAKPGAALLDSAEPLKVAWVLSADMAETFLAKLGILSAGQQ